MKQTTMAFSPGELDELAKVYREALAQRKPRPQDPGLRHHVHLLIRLEAAAGVGGNFWTESGLTIPWVMPVLNKAIADADKVIDLQQQVRDLELELKAAKKPAAKAKGKFPRRKRTPVRAIGPDGRFLPRQQPEAPVPEPAAAAQVEASTP